MTRFIVAAASAAALLIGSFGVGLAAEKSEKMSPGLEMHERGSVKGQPGASGSGT